MNRIRIAIIGAGGIAQKHVAALMKINGVQIISIYDVILQRAKELAVLCGAEAYTDVNESIQSADLVYILTPPSFHKEMAICAMEAGKDVVIEKPISISIEDAEAMVDAAKKWNRKAMVGFNMRYRPGYRKLKEFIQSGKLGSLLNLWSQRNGWNGGGSWRTVPTQLSGFTIESLSHDIDMFRWLSGSEVESVYGDVKNSRSDLPGYDDNALVVLKLKNGSSASIQASWSSHLNFNNRGVIGLNGTAMISGSGSWNFDTFKFRTTDMERESIEELDDKLTIQSYYEENLHFIDCIQNNKKPDMDVEDGLSILRISHAILQSQQENKVVYL